MTKFIAVLTALFILAFAGTATASRYGHDCGRTSTGWLVTTDNKASCAFGKNVIDQLRGLQHEDGGIQVGDRIRLRVSGRNVSCHVSLYTYTYDIACKARRNGRYAGAVYAQKEH